MGKIATLYPCFSAMAPATGHCKPIVEMEPASHFFARFFMTGQFADALVTFDGPTSPGSGCGCPVHRVILAAQSPVLESILASAPTSHETYSFDNGSVTSSEILGVWAIKAPDQFSLRLVLEWCYFASISEGSLTALNCWAVRMAAQQLSISGLMQHVDDWVDQEILDGTGAQNLNENDWGLVLRGALQSKTPDEILKKIVETAARTSLEALEYSAEPSSWEYAKYRFLRRVILREDLYLTAEDVKRAFAVGVTFTRFEIAQLVEAHEDAALPRDIIAEALMRSLVLRSQSLTFENSGSGEAVTSVNVGPHPVEVDSKVSRPSSPNKTPVRSKSSIQIDITAPSDNGSRRTSPERAASTGRILYDDTPMSTVLARLRQSSLDSIPAVYLHPSELLDSPPDLASEVDSNHPGDVSTYELASEFPAEEESISPMKAPIPMDTPSFCGQKSVSGTASSHSSPVRKISPIGHSSRPTSPQKPSPLRRPGNFDRQTSFGFPASPQRTSASQRPGNMERQTSFGFPAPLSPDRKTSLEAVNGGPHRIAANGTQAVNHAPAGRGLSILNEGPSFSEDGPMMALMEVKRQVRMLMDRQQQDRLQNRESDRPMTMSLPQTNGNAVPDRQIHDNRPHPENGGPATMPRPQVNGHAVADRQQHDIHQYADHDRPSTMPRPHHRQPQPEPHAVPDRRLSTPMVLAEVRRRLEDVVDETGLDKAEPGQFDSAATLPEFALEAAAIPAPVKVRPKVIHKQISFAEMPTIIHESSEDASNGRTPDDDDFENDDSGASVDSFRAITPGQLLGIPDYHRHPNGDDADDSYKRHSYEITNPPPAGQKRASAPPRKRDQPKGPANPNSTWAASGINPTFHVPNMYQSTRIRGVMPHNQSKANSDFGFLDLPHAAENGNTQKGGRGGGGGHTAKGSFRMLGFSAAGTVAKITKGRKRKGIVDLFKGS
ncbi:hypothetical protein DFJ77DRAFT_293834 [Powellomyces hirtus]|nr:hypothetical protein DFJ77DRAFT_293834 [Powellomyces hirtus]